MRRPVTPSHMKGGDQPVVHVQPRSRLTLPHQVEFTSHHYLLFIGFLKECTRLHHIFLLYTCVMHKCSVYIVSYGQSYCMFWLFLQENYFFCHYFKSTAPLVQLSGCLSTPVTQQSLSGYYYYIQTWWEPSFGVYKRMIFFFQKFSIKKKLTIIYFLN